MFFNRIMCRFKRCLLTTLISVVALARYFNFATNLFRLVALFVWSFLFSVLGINTVTCVVYFSHLTTKIFSGILSKCDNFFKLKMDNFCLKLLRKLSGSYGLGDNLHDLGHVSLPPDYSIIHITSRPYYEELPNYNDVDNDLLLNIYEPPEYIRLCNGDIEIELNKNEGSKEVVDELLLRDMSFPDHPFDPVEPDRIDISGSSDRSIGLT